MKNHILGLMMLIGTAFSITAQEYVPFPSENCTWKESSRFIGKGFESWIPAFSSLAGDTTINDTLYHKVYFHREDGWFSEETLYAGALRETESKQIIFRPSVACSLDGDDFLTDFGTFPHAEQEYVIYDFGSMEIGNNLFYPNESLTEGQASYTILDIDSIEINGITRKRYVLQDNTSNMYEESYFSEGMGSSLGLMAPFKANNWDFDYSQLSCFEENGNTWQNDLHLEVLDCQLGLTIEETETFEVNISPNPTSHQLNISLPNAPITAHLKLSTLDGKLLHVERIKNVNNHTLSVTDYPQGVYLLTVTVDEKTVLTNRVVIE